MKSQGFTDVRIVELETQFNGITITKTEAKHGTDDVLTHFGAILEFLWDLFLEHKEKRLFILPVIQFE